MLRLTRFTVVMLLTFAGCAAFAAKPHPTPVQWVPVHDRFGGYALVRYFGPNMHGFHYEARYGRYYPVPGGFAVACFDYDPHTVPTKRQAEAEVKACERW